ncbi:MAG: ribosome small subunit-dependent GTPase A [Burkholderiaceae bacterium]
MTRAADALVVATYGRRALVRRADGRRWQALLRGRTSEVAVGDRVGVSEAAADQLVIETVAERSTLIERSVEHRRKLLAANVDQALVLIGPAPRFAEDILLRVMLAARHANVKLLIVANKADHPSFAAIEPRLAVLRALAERVLVASVRDQPESSREILLHALRGHRTVLMGESGMGKSSLLNLLVPGAAQRVGEISEALGSGRHTTTTSCLFEIDGHDDDWIIDTPGFQQFGLAHLSSSERDHAFIDIAPALGGCRFHNCRHDREPGCAVRAAVQAGEIDPLRHRLFLALRDAPA